MPQNPISLNVTNTSGALVATKLDTATNALIVSNSHNPSGAVAFQNIDSSGNLRTTPGGISSSLGDSAATVVKATAGRLCKVSVTTAGAAGAVYDNNLTGASNTAANLIGVIPAIVGVYTFDWPCATGIVYVPGAAQVASITYS